MLQTTRTHDADEEGEAEEGGDDESYEAEDAHSQQAHAALAEDAQERRTYDEGGYEEGEDQPVGEDVDLGDQLVQAPVSEDHLDLAVLQLVEEVMKLARVLGVRVALRELPRGSRRHVARVPEARDELPGRLRRNLRRSLLVGSPSSPPQILSLDQRVEQPDELPGQRGISAPGRFEAASPDLRQGVFPPERSAERPQNVSQLALEHA